ncbi:MAG: carbohydrate-binding domain-containing protein [Butyrivibrio sp.]|nr:carbohydrate-binding domain-containing protein [Butyrivibrio sp.]
MKKRSKFLAILFLSCALVMGGCGSSNAATAETEVAGSNLAASENAGAENVGNTADESSEQGTTKSDENLAEGSVEASSDTLIDTSDIFTDRDLEQEADLSDAEYITLEDGKDVTISTEGVYVIQGSATDATIIVEADDTAKVQLVLDGVDISNSDFPCIYVKSADKVFVTSTGDNKLAVTGTFVADGETNTDAVIFSKDDLVLNGTGSVTITSTANGITCKDDLKITGGSFNIDATEDAIEANDSVSISDGSFTIKAGKDAIHCENSDDTTVGSVYISGGSFDIEATDDGIQATTVLMIDGGTLDITAAEGLEGTYIQINDGTISISASDDGVNASAKSSSYDPVIEINGGSLTIVMGSGDTDALDANGSLYINGGTVDITAQFAFDFDKEAKLNGGTVIVNGEEVTEITNSMFGGQGGQGFGGQGGQGFGGQGFGGRGGRGNNGERTFGENGEMPESGDGTTPPQMPEDFDGTTPPQMPEGGTPPQMNGKASSGTNAQEQ